MPQEDELLHQVGEFEPFEAKRVLDEFETQGIPFEIESDHSALFRAGRDMQLNFGMYPPGSKLLVFVPESRLPQAEAIVQKLFPL